MKTLHMNLLLALSVPFLITACGKEQPKTGGESGANAPVVATAAPAIDGYKEFKFGMPPEDISKIKGCADEMGTPTCATTLFGSDVKIRAGFDAATNKANRYQMSVAVFSIDELNEKLRSFSDKYQLSGGSLPATADDVHAGGKVWEFADGQITASAFNPMGTTIALTVTYKDKNAATQAKNASTKAAKDF